MQHDQNMMPESEGVVSAGGKGDQAASRRVVIGQMMKCGADGEGAHVVSRSTEISCSVRHVQLVSA